MLKKNVFYVVLLAVSFTKICFSDTLMTKWKCAVYPYTDNPYTKNYVLVEFNQQKATTYTYLSTALAPSHFCLNKLHYKFIGKTKNNPRWWVYLYAENNAILVIDTVKHRVAESSVLMPLMADHIDDTEEMIFGKKLKLQPYQKAGGVSRGYYCNIDQNIKLPVSTCETTDGYERI